jgi:transcriptional regulator with XRE-family HTH domain
MTASTDTPLRRILDEEGRKQVWLAGRLGVDPEQVNRWVAGRHIPAEATRNRIAELLHRKVEDLFPPEIYPDLYDPPVPG